MSSLLENAIVDATALKEAALKNAENAVIEKYADEIKEAVETLLEQPEDDPFAELGDMEGEGEASPEEAEFITDLPSAATEGEELCPCPDEEEEINIDFDQLAAEMDAESGSMAPSDMTDRGAVASELVQEVSEEELDGLVEMLSELAEEVTVNADGGSKAGWGLQNDADRQHEEDVEEAVEAHNELDEEKEELEEQVVKLSKHVQKLNESNKEYKKILFQLKEKLEDVNLSNARLHYANRILGSASLNERQKTEIVESISKAGTIEEAKVIYTTLQSTVGVSSSKRKPKSLSEAVHRRSSSLMVSRRKSSDTQTDPALERMRRLAGIIK